MRQKKRDTKTKGDYVVTLSYNLIVQAGGPPFFLIHVIHHSPYILRTTQGNVGDRAWVHEEDADAGDQLPLQQGSCRCSEGEDVRSSHAPLRGAEPALVIPPFANLQ